MPALGGQANILSAGSHLSRHQSYLQCSTATVRQSPRRALIVLAGQKDSKRARRPSAPSQLLQPTTSGPSAADEVSAALLALLLITAHC